jgi:hypothetical protein
MRLIVKLLHRLWAKVTARPPVPCCASAIRWANFR